MSSNFAQNRIMPGRSRPSSDGIGQFPIPGRLRANLGDFGHFTVYFHRIWGKLGAIPGRFRQISREFRQFPGEFDRSRPKLVNSLSCLTDFGRIWPIPFFLQPISCRIGRLPLCFRRFSPIADQFPPTRSLSSGGGRKFDPQTFVSALFRERKSGPAGLQPTPMPILKVRANMSARGCFRWGPWRPTWVRGLERILGSFCRGSRF